MSTIMYTYAWSEEDGKEKRYTKENLSNYSCWFRWKESKPWTEINNANWKTSFSFSFSLHSFLRVFTPLFIPKWHKAKPEIFSNILKHYNVWGRIRKIFFFLNISYMKAYTHIFDILNYKNIFMLCTYWTDVRKILFLSLRIIIFAFCVVLYNMDSVYAVDIYVNLWFICQRINMIDMHHWWNT